GSTGSATIRRRRCGRGCKVLTRFRNSIVASGTAGETACPTARPPEVAGHFQDDVETARACGAGLQRLQPAPQAQPNSSTSGDLNQKEATRRRVASGPLEKGTSAKTGST